MGRHYLRIMMAFFSLSLIACLCTRTYLVLVNTDIRTGFYITQNTPVAIVFGGVLAAFIIAAFLSGRLKKTDNDYPVVTRGRAGGAVALLAGLSALTSIFLDGINGELIQGRSTTFAFIGEILMIVFGTLAGISLLCYGTMTLIGKGKPPALLMLAPALWQGVSLVAKFNSYTTLLPVMDNLLTVLCMIFFAVFFIGHARTICGFMRRDGRNYAIPAGLSASLCGFSLVIPNYCFMIYYGSGMPAQMLSVPQSITILLLSTYALIFCAGMTRSIKFV